MDNDVDDNGDVVGVDDDNEYNDDDEEGEKYVLKSLLSLHLSRCQLPPPNLPTINTTEIHHRLL